MMLSYLLIFMIIFLALRCLYLLAMRYPSFKMSSKAKLDKESFGDRKVKSVIVLGSGGHTTEMLAIVSRLNSEKYYKYYVIATSDKRSYDRVLQCEADLKGSVYELLYIPRSREVAQAWASSVWTTLVSIIYCIPMMVRIRPHLVLCNGPGTCIPVVLVAWILHVLYLAHPKIIFVESLCRVKSLSLSGKILRYFADEIVVQWPELAIKYPDTRYIGRL